MSQPTVRSRVVLTSFVWETELNVNVCKYKKATKKLQEQVGMVGWKSTQTRGGSIPWACAHSNKMAFRYEPSNQMCRKCLVLTVNSMLKPLMHHCTAPCKTELIYAWIKLKGQGSHELVLEMKRKKREERMTIGCFLNSWFWYVQLF